MNIDRYHFDDCNSDASAMVNSFDGEYVRYCDHAAAIAAKDAEYATLDAAFAHAVDRAEEGLTVIAAKDAEIERLKGVVGNQHKTLFAKSDRITEQDRRIAELEQQYAAATKSCVESRGERDDFGRQLSFVRQELQVADGLSTAIISDLRAALATAQQCIAELESSIMAIVSAEHARMILNLRAEAQRNADAAEALAGLERLGGKHCLSYNDAVGRWEILLTVGNDNMFEVFAQAPTKLAAVRAAEEEGK